MKILIRYSERLGDVIRMFPAAKHFSAQGHDVYIECFPQYHEIFDCITYATPITQMDMRGTVFDKVYLPQIWPSRYQAFRESGKTWMDFVYSIYPEWREIDRTIKLDRLGPDVREEYGLPANFSLIFPFATSSRTVSLPCVFREAASRMDMENAFLFMSPVQRENLIAQGFEPSRALTVRHLSHLPRLIRDAKEVLTVNTSTTIIASAVRSHYYHIADPNQQDNWSVPNQTAIIL